MMSNPRNIHAAYAGTNLILASINAEPGVITVFSVFYLLDALCSMQRINVAKYERFEKIMALPS